MPLNIPLGLWIVYGGGEGAAQMEPFARSLMFNILPTIVFLVIAWQAAKAGWSIVSILVAGYAGWGVGLGLVLILRQMLGV
jgi:hypothetical protein